MSAERPRDLTLRMALGDRQGWATLYEFTKSVMRALQLPLSGGICAICGDAIRGYG